MQLFKRTNDGLEIMTHTEPVANRTKALARLARLLRQAEESEDDGMSVEIGVMVDKPKLQENLDGVEWL